MPRRHVSVALRCAAWAEALPRADRFARRVVGAVLDDRRVGVRHATEVGVVLADDGFVRRLNREHRGMDKPTNVLSFPLDDVGTPSEERQLLGDIVLAYRTIKREAAAEGKSVRGHAAHLLVHGTLHLLGFDHAGAGPARIMEGHEVRILRRLGVSDPYRARGHDRAPARERRRP